MSNCSNEIQLTIPKKATTNNTEKPDLFGSTSSEMPSTEELLRRLKGL